MATLQWNILVLFQFYSPGRAFCSFLCLDIWVQLHYLSFPCSEISLNLAAFCMLRRRMSFYIAITCRHRAVHELSSQQYTFVLQQGEQHRTQLSRSFPRTLVKLDLYFTTVPSYEHIWYDRMIFFRSIYIYIYIFKYTSRPWYCFHFFLICFQWFCVCVLIFHMLPVNFHLWGVVHWRCNSAWWLAWCSWSVLECLERQVVTSMGVSGYPKMVGLMRENPTKMDDLGVPLFQETSIWIYCSLGILDEILDSDGIHVLWRFWSMLTYIDPFGSWKTDF